MKDAPSETPQLNFKPGATYGVLRRGGSVQKSKEKDVQYKAEATPNAIIQCFTSASSVARSANGKTKCNFNSTSHIDILCYLYLLPGTYGDELGSNFAELLFRSSLNSASSKIVEFLSVINLKMSSFIV